MILTNLQSVFACVHNKFYWNND